MDILYKLSTPEPQTHMANVRLIARKEKDQFIDVFMPSWSPGSYFMREYARNVKFLQALDKNGNRLVLKKVDKGTWRIFFNDKMDVGDEFEIKYETYCHDLTVRTSHIDMSHAFIHGPSVFLGVLNKDIKPTLEIDIHPMWTKISTGLKDISKVRDHFIYEADNYDEFIDCPIEIGCHETDGFMIDGIPHELATYGSYIGDKKKFKKDIKLITEHIVQMMGGVPYKRYIYMSHLAPHLFGGLEHGNSTVLQYDSFSMNDEKGYRGWLELVAHEFFHTWNVKRIRPKVLGPFDYTREALTRMHWLTEGLTSFVDQQVVYRCGLSKLEDYLDSLKDNINRYLQTPGRKYQSLEDSSFDAWIKLYHGGEYHNNSSISYYLKGGLVFLVIHLMLKEQNKTLLSFIHALWNDYQQRPDVGLTKDEVIKIFESVSDKPTSEQFSYMMESIDEIDFETILSKHGVKFEYEEQILELGFTPEFKNGSVKVKSVREDGAAYKFGLNAGDEIVAINDMKYSESVHKNLSKILNENENYTLTVFRANYLHTISIQPLKSLKLIKKIEIVDRDVAENSFKI